MSILDTIKTIMDSETSEFRAEQEASLAALTLASDNKFRQEASNRAQEELELKLRNETETHLKDSKRNVELEIQNETDNLVDRYFKPLFITDDGQYNDTTGALDEDTFNLTGYRDLVYKNLETAGFSSSQQKEIYAVVTAYLSNPGQHTIVTNYIKDILSSGNIKDYTKGFSNIGLFAEITDEGVVSQYNLAKGNSVLARFSQLNTVSEDIDTEIEELKKTGDLKIQRETGIPDTEVSFDLKQAFSNQVKSEAEAVAGEISDRNKILESIDSVVADNMDPEAAKIKSGEGKSTGIYYDNDERKELTRLMNALFEDEDKGLKAFGLSSQNTSIKGSAKYDLAFYYKNKSTMSDALALISKKRTALEKEKKIQTKRRKDEMNMYSDMYSTQSQMNPEDMRIYSELSTNRFDSEIKALDKLESIIQRDKLFISNYNNEKKK